MRKLVLLGLVFTLASGCGRGWLPIFRGAPCNTGSCGIAAPALPASYDAGCTDCGYTTGYDSYDTGVVSGGDSYGGVVNGDTYYGSGVIDSGTVNGGITGGTYSGQGAIINPPMQQLAPSLPAN